MKYKTLSAPEKWIIKGIPLLFLAGSIFHFLYELTGNSTLVGLFVPVNESIFEHLKLALIPIIAWWTIYYAVKHKSKNIDPRRWFGGALVSLVVTLLLIPMLYYFYTGAFGIESTFVDILILLIALLAGQLLGLHFYRHSDGINPVIVYIIFALIIILFMVATVFTPELPLWKDPMTGTYGI